MTQGNYIENTQDLIRRSQQVMGDIPVLDLTNWQQTRYMSNTSQLKSLAGSCHFIEVTNTVDGEPSKCPVSVASSIILCTSSVIGDCPVDTSDPCPAGNTVGTTQYMNMIAVFDMGAAQTGVQVTFKYVLNGTPTSTTVTTDVVLGSNYVYAFTTNQLYPAGTTLVLYGAEVLA